jgi:serine/threonine protein kinase
LLFYVDINFHPHHVPNLVLLEHMPRKQRIPQQLSDEYEVGKKLGTGSYAVVREARNRVTGETFAVKIIEKKHAKESRLKSEVSCAGPSVPSRNGGKSMICHGRRCCQRARLHCALPQKQVSLMSQVDHPNCVKLWDVFSDADRLCLVLDLCTYQDPIFTILCACPCCPFALCL